MTKSKIDDSKKMLSELEICVFDLETTGGNQKSDKIIEIGLVKIKNLEIVEEKNFLINPEIKIPEFIQKLTNIKESDVKDSPKIDDIIDEILNFMGDSILVAHNISFDVPFFNSVLRRLNRNELRNKSLCTNLMTKYLIPDLLNSNLNYMSKIFNISHSKAHRALDDARATANLLLKYLEVFIQKEISKINHLYYPRNRFELDRMNIKKEKGNDYVLKKIKNLSSNFLITVKGENGIILFSMPCRSDSEHYNFILESIKHLDWEIITIRLFGPLIEAIIHFNNLFPKIADETKQKIIIFLESAHVGTKNPYSEYEKNQTNTDLEINIQKEIGDFLIAPHLVPDQLIILPISSMNLKNQLTFRYPGHQKKLFQYIKSKTSRLKNNKLKKTLITPDLKKYIYGYLLKNKNNQSDDLLIFNKNLIQKNSNLFIKSIEEYLSKNNNSYNYPADYI